jgi:hypothetical protein
MIYRMHQIISLSAIERTRSLIMGVGFLAAIVSGGLLSIDKPMPTAILRLHQVASTLTVLSTIATLSLLFTRKAA